MKKIVIAGNSVSAWMATAFLAVHKPQLACDISLVLTDTDQSPRGLVAVHPMFMGFLKALNVNEQNFLKVTEGSILLGHQYLKWSGPDHEYLHTFGGAGVKNIVDFHHLFLSVKAGADKRIQDYSLSAVAAQNGRFFPLPQEQVPFRMPFQYGMQFDLDAFCVFLKTLCKNMNIPIYESGIGRVHRAGDQSIESLELPCGTSLSGDVFIDADESAVLMSGFSDNVLEPWTGGNPINAVAECIRKHSEPVPYRTLQAEAEGILTLTTSRRQQHIKYLFNDQQGVDPSYVTSSALKDRVGEDLLSLSVRRFQPGLRKQLWQKNCLAIGRAACQFDGLITSEPETNYLELRQLIKCFPKGATASYSKSEYERSVKASFSRCRDFWMTHFRVAHPFVQTGTAGGLSKGVHGLIPSKDLDLKLRVFQSRASVINFEGEVFCKEMEWASFLLGMGVRPNRVDMMAAASSESEQKKFLSSIEQSIRSTVMEMPTLSCFLEQHV